MAALGKITDWWLGADGLLHTYQSSTTITPPPPPPTSSPSARAVITSQSNLTAAFSAATSTPGSAPIVSYAWDYGDGTTGTGLTPSHTYAQPGTYNVRLTATAADGLSAQAPLLTVVAVAANQPPVSSFVIVSQSGLTVTVDASGSSDPDGTIARYAWNFGDGGGDTGAVVTHTYAQPGTYIITNAVYDNRGGSATSAQSVAVAAPNTAPTAVITSAVVNGMTVAFDGSGSSDPDAGDSIQRWDWNFGDGSGVQASGQKVSHTYATLGPWVTTLAVYDQNGGSATDSVTVTPTSTTPPVSGGPNGVEPTGPNIVSVDSLSGSDISAKIDATPAGKQTSMGPKVYEFNGFSKQYNTLSAGFGVQINKATALLGSGIDKTIVRMSAASAANTGKKAPTSGVTFLEYFWTGTSFKLLQDLTIQGMPINDGDWGPDGGYQPPSDTYPKTRNAYNGLYLAKFNNGVVRRVKVTHIPGSIYYPPGETFGIDVYSTDTALFEDLILDGENVGASGFGPNSSGNLTVRRMEAFGWKYGIATAWADCFGNNVIEDAYIHDSRSGMNFEQNHMTSLQITRPRFANIKSLTGVTNHLTLWGSSATSGTYAHGSTSYPVRIDNPTYDTPKLNIWVPAKYSDGTPNCFKQSDVHVYQNGVDVTSSTVFFRN